MSDSILRTEHLAIGYSRGRGARTVVADGITVSLVPGEIVCLVGPNGAGKSTLIRTVAGLQPPLSGAVYVEETELASLTPRERARRIGVVLTERVNVGMLSAAALVSLGRYPYTDWTGRLSDEDRAVVDWALRSVGAHALASRHVAELSDGERQKIMIARALAQKPHLLALDEPTAFLDLTRRVELMRLLSTLSRETGSLILLSTHDLELALRSADRIWLLPGDGSFHEGAPEDHVLAGTFERTFKSDGVSFDRESGSFVVTKPGGTRIVLRGGGFAALWTRKALERAGYEMVTGGEGAAVLTVSENDGVRFWELECGGVVGRYDSVYDVMRAIRMKLGGS